MLFPPGKIKNRFIPVDNPLLPKLFRQSGFFRRGKFSVQNAKNRKQYKIYDAHKEPE